MRGRWLETVILAIAAATQSACTLTPSELTPAATAHLPARVELAQVPFFPQDDYQCGPAALATVLSTAGIDITPETLTPEIFLPGRKGSLAVELLAATRRRNRVPYSVPETPVAILEELAAGRPVLVMQNLGLKMIPVWHFAVAVGYDLNERTMILRSGTTERRVLDERRFLRSWNLAQRWAVVVLNPDQLPANPELDRYIAAVASLEAVGQLDAAKQAYTRAHEHWPQSAWPALGLANISYTRGRFREAEEAYRTALAIEPENAVAHNNLAEILLRRGCISDASASAQRAASLAEDTALEDAVAATLDKIENAALTSATVSSSCMR